MATFTRKKYLRLASSFYGRARNCYRIMIPKVEKALQYAYRDRKVKKRLTRRQWIMNINSAVREHGLTYSNLQYSLTRSNIILDRKILADLAYNEPLSFKAVVDEAAKQVDKKVLTRTNPKYLSAKGLSYEEALQKGYLRTTAPTKEELEQIEKELIPPQAQLFGLRFPERDSKKPADYMRLSFREEDEAYLKEQQRLTLTDKEQKKIPMEVL